MQTVHPGLVSIPLSEKQCRDLRTRRTALGLTQRELARRVGCSTRTILRLENAQWALSPEMLSTVCGILGLQWNVDLKVTLRPATIKKAKRGAGGRISPSKRKRVRA